MVDFSYQDKAANKVFENLLNPSFRASVLAACPSAGKTTISQKIINTYVAQFPNARVVVLTEGQKALRSQYLDELDDAHIAINFKYGGFKSHAQVKVGLPQSIDQLEWDQIDLLVVDEAQNFYFAKMVQDIIRKYLPKHQLLMTGSPTKYNLFNQQLMNGKKFGMYYISAEELQDKGVFSGVDIDVVKVIDRKNAVGSIMSVMARAKNKGDDLSKIMVACPNISYAYKVANTLRSLGYRVSVSTSKNDPNDFEIKRFKDGLTNALVVVGKGILGFNDKYMTTLMDLRSSDNLDASYQLFARVLRTHPSGSRKAYLRIGDSDYQKQCLTAHKMIALMKRDIFVHYNGKNLKVA